MMTEIMKKHLKKKKGFTLIEVVVVLVILAILAAIAVPALTGYIDDARERSAKSEARTIYVALQHMTSTADEDATFNTYFTGSSPYSLTTAGKARISKLTGIDTAKLGTTSNITFSTDNDSIIGFTYNTAGSNSITITFADGKYTKA